MGLRIPLAPAWIRWTAVGSVATIILYFMVIGAPVSGLPTRGPFELVGFDKWLHALDYAVFTLVLAYALVTIDRSLPVFVVLVTMSALGYGTAVETLQLALPHRAFSIYDLGANAVGIGLAGGIVWITFPEIQFTSPAPPSNEAGPTH